MTNIFKKCGKKRHFGLGYPSFKACVKGKGINKMNYLGDSKFITIKATISSDFYDDLMEGSNDFNEVEWEING